MLQVKNITFSYQKTPVLKNVEFSVKEGEYLAIIGESGSGKSTLLKLLYGEFDLDEGNIHWKNTEILGPAYNLVIGYDFMKYVAQEFDLMPYITVAENIGKHLSNFFPEEKQIRINELLKVVELEAFANTKVQFLSGGQKQRVALARALAKQPEIILLDEPFSHIDNFKKQSLRRNIFQYLKHKNITCIVATHDKNDVLGYADQMLVVHQGQTVAKNTPEALYKNPETPLVASFFEEFNSIEPYGIVYANKLKVVNNTSELKAEVIQSYFKGSYYLIEATLNGKTIWFQNKTIIAPKTEVLLKVEIKKPAK